LVETRLYAWQRFVANNGYNNTYSQSVSSVVCAARQASN